MLRSRKTDFVAKSRTKRLNKRRKKPVSVPLVRLLFFVMAILLFALLYFTVFLISKNNIQEGPKKVLRPSSREKEELKRSAKNNNKNSVDQAIEQVVATLMNLADMPLHDLQDLLEGDQSHNSPFKIDKLQEGLCPYSSTESLPNWLPPKVPAKPAKWFEHYNTQTSPIVAVYYEHLSKAGGTSFCTLAEANMVRKVVPNYYCMPSKPKMVDARVGSWSEAELQTYFKEHPHRLVSNEWEPFNTQFMDHFDHGNSEVQLVFVTSIRNPINRLLSAHKFWGVLHNPSEAKPSFELWLQRVNKRAKRWYVLSGDFMANVGRFNFATWKFSGGKIPITDLSFNAEQNLKIGPEDDIGRVLAQKHMSKEEWEKPFKTAVRMLSKFDLVIPMEELSKHSQPVTDTLGWTDFSKAHVVPSGKVMNNKGSTQLPPQEYDLLWRANALDYILYYWSLAVYLARLHCAEYIQ